MAEALYVGGAVLAVLLLGSPFLVRSLYRRRDRVIGRFDDEYSDLEEQLSALKDQLQPYEDYVRYLETPERDEIFSHIEDLEQLARKLRDRARWVLAPGRRKDAETVRGELQELRRFLDGYNERFVQREMDRHQDLFVVGDGGWELNDQQKRAVIRDDRHNLVVAGAGTGKTAVLTTRAAYLTERRDRVPPDRILAVAFNNEATDEMETRLEEDFDVTGAEVTTFHSFGKGIIDQVEDSQPEVFDKNDMRQFLRQTIEEETQEGRDTPFKEFYFEYLKHYYDEHVEEADFETKEAYYEKLQDKDYTTLRGEAVRSMAEKRIADFLLLNRVPYEYEATASWMAPEDSERSPKPDFYLPDHDLYIEHWGIDRDGEVAPWFSRSSEEYREEMEWKRARFDVSDEYNLVETFHYQWDERSLEASLGPDLRGYGVDLEPMDYETFVEEVYDLNENESEILKLFREFIRNAKARTLGPDEIEGLLPEDIEKVYNFGRAAEILYRRYEDHLEAKGRIDFEDMIQKATDHVAEGQEFRERYDHILVDEFQDVGPAEVGLLRALVRDTKTTVFCVGDDWQSINSFAAADVHYIVNFEEEFPEPELTRLESNYRCPDPIVEAGNELISHNDDQIDKNVIAEKGDDSKPIVHVLPEKKGGYEANLKGSTVALVKKLVEEHGVPEGDIMVLCRFKVLYFDDIENQLASAGISSSTEKNREGVRLRSVHRAKGTEAPYVILMDASEGPWGFPPQVEDHELLEPVRLRPENKMAEERRLFYVALTRTEEELHILTRHGHTSRFLDEIEEYWEDAGDVEDEGGEGETEDANLALLREGGERVDVTARVSKLFKPTEPEKRAGIDQCGVLKNDTGEIKYKSWDGEASTILEEGQEYRIEDARTTTHKGNVSLVLDEYTYIEATR